jgi:hypothetical protein
MHIYIDESGSFTGFHPSSISAVGALAIPDCKLAFLIRSRQCQRQRDGITVRQKTRTTSATKSALNGHRGAYGRNRPISKGHLAIKKGAFRKSTGDIVVWDRGYREWRKRRGFDKPGRQQGAGLLPARSNKSRSLTKAAAT